MAKVESLLFRVWCISVICYYVSHIPITLCLDLQGLLHSFYPTVLQDLLSWYVKNFNDPLMGGQPVWFKSFIFWECFQVPYFAVAANAMINRDNSIRIPSIIYGAHVSTTVSAILSDLYFSQKVTHEQRMVLLALYLPYFIFPFSILVYFAAYSEPFGSASKKKNR